MKQISITVTHALVLLDHFGMDQIFLTTTLPSSIPKLSNEEVTFQFRAEADTGADYVKKHFGIDPEVRSMNAPRTKLFSEKK